MSYDTFLQQKFHEHENEQAEAEAAYELERRLWASNVLEQYFGIERLLTMHRRIGTDACIEIAEAIEEAEEL